MEKRTAKMMISNRLPLLLLAASVLLNSAAADEIVVLPKTFSLSGSEGRQQLMVVHVSDSENVPAAIADDEVQWTSANPQVVAIDNGVAIAVGNGSTTITARIGDTVSTARVTVDGIGEAYHWSFRNDVQSVLSRLGCNTGACHGALAGKGGFRLSLRGYDSDSDFVSITREAKGRRVELSDPGRSLLIAKPSGALPHKGGLRLDTESRDYRVLSSWIASGAAGPSEDDPRLEKISVTPAASMLRPGDQTRVLVNAHYDDGRVVDVTHWAVFSATDEAIVTVDEDGLVEVVGCGEGAVLVWFGSKVALARMTVPYPHEIADEVYVTASRRNFIDDLNLAQLKTLNLRPSPRCDDETFLRRATLDTIGRLPSLSEREIYMAEPAIERRDRLIEKLLASDDFVDYWTYRWCDILLVNGTRLRPVAVKTYYQWIREQVQQNKPWDQMVREILTASGLSNENGATNFYALHQTPEEMTENACQAFLGLSIGCAKCHNHPLEKWSNDQYYAMANLFARVRAKGWGGDSRNGDGIRTLYVATAGDLIQPNRGKPQPPAPLDAPPLKFDDPSDRRDVLADWMTDPSNPYFARAITNRVWANFFGRGLVEQVDDLRLSNPSSNEPLLAAAAQYTVDAEFDLKKLMRVILQSETYQRSSIPLPENQLEQKYLSRYYPRRLMAEVMLDSIDQTLQTASKFDQVAFPGADKQKTDYYPPGTKAIELYDAAVASYFLDTFGRNPREITCECERSAEQSMVQVLHLSNGETLNPKLEDANNRIANMIAAGKSPSEMIDTLFFAALSRSPSHDEQERLLGVIDEYGDELSTAMQDVAWSVLTSTEFTFNH
ncbi:secreted protein containing DUF1549 [Rhodopirellula maiorica SM1]|uniref:Secreted protein containing DUF1549 n=2 Tax=Novipirellula TaxID=2795426 RepID=M5RMY7_9BACT|nr:secreted protein containing DUF1549 [Rhodopirellula maiorica SM1]